MSQEIIEQKLGEIRAAFMLSKEFGEAGSSYLEQDFFELGQERVKELDAYLKTLEGMNNE